MNITEGIDINITVNGQLVTFNNRIDHPDHIDIDLSYDDVSEAMQEDPGIGEPLTFGNTGCVRRRG